MELGLSGAVPAMVLSTAEGSMGYQSTAEAVRSVSIGPTR